jgi:hypothetical protein
VFRDYVVVWQEKEYKGKKDKKSKGLPPGLAKKVARGGELPPGWQKKLHRGEVLSEVIYKQSTPVPYAILKKLPDQPPGTVLISLDGKIIRLAEATRRILDVFDLID